MDLVGDEKRIQALFSELSLEDQSSLPRFEELWKAQRLVGPAHVRRFSSSAVKIAVALLVVTGCSLGAWSWYRSTRLSKQNTANVAPQEISTPPSRPAEDSLAQESNDREIAAPGRKSHPRHRKNLARLQRTEGAGRPDAALRRTERPAIRDAALLSRWQSPTQIFLELPAGLALNSLPQLNESAEQLKGFLPKTNEPTKESNQ